MSSEYRNGNPIDIPSNEVEKSLTISEWSEGNRHLEDAITSCIESGIPTYASCAGHSLFDFPYIAMGANKDNFEKVLNIMNNVYNMPNISIALSYMENQGSILTISSSMLNRNKCFDSISKASKENTSLENINEEIQKLCNLHNQLRKHQYGLEHSLEINKGNLSKTVIIRDYSGYLHKILDDVNFKRDNVYGARFKRFYATRSLKNILEQIREQVECEFDKNDDNEFNEKTKKESRDFVKKVNVEYKIQEKSEEGTETEKAQDVQEAREK